ncbi:MAG: NCS2 family permease, partial [Angelakisella sp.]
VPAFLTIAMMPLSYSIANGIAFGLISYVLIKVCSGRYKEVHITTAVLAALFIIKYFVAI